ncbi:hypothetical protein B0H67DRAFT_596593 [Lasiosphaeris hirsuta]|uniref:Uncharacterized protein n=1 Tax=Lasiosphaeris hirsuta TaxID=260670 RepID=A0AA40E835_9PEZI|nr:hypothetical protein B0H67DRAFT_596593 [Lasiosphaeris hirsuta]
MGASMSYTVGAYAFCFLIAGSYYVFATRRARSRTVKPSGKQRLDERPNMQVRKEKEKTKRQRGEAHSKDVDESVKATQPKLRPAPKAAPAPSQPVEDSSDDGVDNREFARQLASIKQGTNLNAPKKSEEKRQKSVKQSRARLIDEPVVDNKVSAPSSTTGVDGDDDESPLASPQVQAVDAGDVTDMLEPKAAAGPAVLRLTDTDKIKQKEKKTKEPEKVETKKQRQNRLKAEAAKAVREESEKQRQVALEAQRRLARISEGRAAKDGSTFVAAQAAQSVWSDKGANTSSASSLTNGGHLPVQPLDTFDTSSHADGSVSKAATPAPSKTDNYLASLSSLPSEEEQLKLLLGQEDWNTVTTKKSNKGKKKDPVTDNEAESTATQTQQAVPAAFQAVATKAQKTSINGNGKPTKSFSQQSSFAALSPADEPEVEEEWDV